MRPEFLIERLKPGDDSGLHSWWEYTWRSCAGKFGDAIFSSQKSIRVVGSFCCPVIPQFLWHERLALAHIKSPRTAVFLTGFVSSSGEYLKYSHDDNSSRLAEDLRSVGWKVSFASGQNSERGDVLCIDGRLYFSCPPTTQNPSSIHIESLESEYSRSLNEVFDGIEAHEDAENVDAPYIRLLKGITRECAMLIARDADGLRYLEWRDVERLMAEVFEGLGFEVELTPSSKDMGRDLVLRCNVRGQGQEYYVEIKHWRAGGRAGKREVHKLLDVLVRDKVDGGLILSSSGFTRNAVSSLSLVERRIVSLGAAYSMGLGYRDSGNPLHPSFTR